MAHQVNRHLAAAPAVVIVVTAASFLLLGVGVVGIQCVDRHESDVSRGQAVAEKVLQAESGVRDQIIGLIAELTREHEGHL